VLLENDFIMGFSIGGPEKERLIWENDVEDVVKIGFVQRPQQKLNDGSRKMIHPERIDRGFAVHATYHCPEVLVQVSSCRS
jgi:hypothetical protein